MITATDGLLDRPSVVVGGASGLGLAVVRKAVEHTKSVAVFDLSASASDELSTLSEVDYRQANVLDPEALSNAFASFAERGPIGNVYVSAGITLPAPIDVVSAADAQRCLMINLMGSVNTIQAALPHLTADASIVLTASAAAYTGGGYVGGSIYGASKAGVIGLTLGAARELAGRGIRVNCVAPGAATTGMVGDEPALVARLIDKTLLNRLATAEDIANGVLHLWSSGGAYMTGATLDINGGSHLG